MAICCRTIADVRSPLFMPRWTSHQWRQTQYQCISVTDRQRPPVLCDRLQLQILEPRLGGVTGVQLQGEDAARHSGIVREVHARLSVDRRANVISVGDDS